MRIEGRNLWTVGASHHLVHRSVERLLVSFPNLDSSLTFFHLAKILPGLYGYHFFSSPVSLATAGRVDETHCCEDADNKGGLHKIGETHEVRQLFYEMLCIPRKW
jgi:hypothetical protein